MPTDTQAALSTEELRTLLDAYNSDDLALRITASGVLQNEGPCLAAEVLALRAENETLKAKYDRITRAVKGMIVLGEM